MDYNTISKIPEAFSKHPIRTMLIIFIMALIAILAMFFSGYFSELGNRAASGSGTENKAGHDIQVGEIKTGDQSPVIVGDHATITYGASPAVVDDLRKTLNLKDKVIERFRSDDTKVFLRFYHIKFPNREDLQYG